MDTPTEADHDQALLGAWEQGDQQGFEGLVVRYSPLVYARCRRALGAGDADDATQAVFLVLARKRDQAAANPALAAWLLTVADHVIRNARRDLARRRQAESTVPQPLPTDEGTMPDIQEHLDAALAELPEGERVAIQLYMLAGHTLAEVSGHVGSPVSTVHARVERGLKRLRSILTGRGVTVGSLGLVMALNAEATTQVPAVVQIHLRALTAAGRGGGATSAASVRAQRWSQQGLSTMTKIAIAGAALTLGLFSTLTWLRAADAGVPAHAVPAVVNAVSTSSAASPAPAEPDRQWYLLRLNNGARTVERLKSIPEMVFLPKNWQVLQDLSMVRDAGLAFDPWTHLTANERRLVMEHAQGQPWTEADFNTVMTAAPRMSKKLSSRAWVVATTDQALVLTHLRAWLDSGSSSWFPAAKPGATASAEVARLTSTANRLDARFDPTSASALADINPAQWPGLDAAADVEVSLVSTAATHSCTDTITISLDANGVHMSAHVAGPKPDLVPPTLDPTAFANLPKDAFAGFVMAVSPATTAHDWSNLWSMIGRISTLQKTKTEGASAPDLLMNNVLGPLLDPEKCAHIRTAIERIDGRFACWIQPGEFLPKLSFTVDMPEDAAHLLLSAIGKPSADGSVVTSFMSLGWRGGKLMGTTLPNRWTDVVESGGFTDHADVQRALSALSKNGLTSAAIVRPEILVEQIPPVLVASFTPEQQQQIIDYRKRLADSKAFGFMATNHTVTGVKTEAGGMMAIIAGAVMGGMMSQPQMMMMKTIN